MRTAAAIIHKIFGYLPSGLEELNIKIYNIRFDGIYFSTPCIESDAEKII